MVALYTVYFLKINTCLLEFGTVFPTFVFLISYHVWSHTYDDLLYIPNFVYITTTLHVPKQVFTVNVSNSSHELLFSEHIYLCHVLMNTSKRKLDRFIDYSKINNSTYVINRALGVSQQGSFVVKLQNFKIDITTCYPISRLCEMTRSRCMDACMYGWYISLPYTLQSLKYAHRFVIFCLSLVTCISLSTGFIVGMDMQLHQFKNVWCNYTSMPKLQRRLNHRWSFGMEV